MNTSTCDTTTVTEPQRDAQRFLIRRVSGLRTAPWCIISPVRLRMVGCLGYVDWSMHYRGKWIYPFPTQAMCIRGIENALKRELIK